MPEAITINVAKFLESTTCVSWKQGKSLMNKIQSALETNHRVRISFSECKYLGAAFLNAATAQLYNTDQNDFIGTEKIAYDNLEEYAVALMQKVAGNARRYAKNSAIWDKAWKEIFDEARQ